MVVVKRQRNKVIALQAGVTRRRKDATKKSISLTVNKTLQFHIDYTAYPNGDNTTQIRKFKLSDDELYYEVPAKAEAGTIAVSTWTRSKKNN